MKKRKNFKAKWAGIALLTGIVVSGGCKQNGNIETGANPEASNRTIKIGLYTSMTGGTATYGQSTYKGVAMALEEVNAAGGVQGNKLRLIVEDNAGKPEQSITAVQKLIAADQVLAILGEVASSNSLAAAPICQSAKVPMISTMSTNPEVTRKGDYIFRTCFIDPFQGTVCARFAAQHLKAKTVGILVDNKSDYSRGLAKFFSDEFNKSGKVVATQYYNAGDGDFRAQLTSIKAKNPDVLFIPGYYSEVSLIALQARQLGMKQKLLGGDAWDSPKLVEIGKGAMQGGYFSTHYVPESKEPRVQKFVAAYKKKYKGETPDSLAAMGYDAANMLVAAMKTSGVTTANETSRKKLRDALAQTSKFPGVTGDITMNQDRNAVKPAVMLQVKGQKFTYVSTVQP